MVLNVPLSTELGGYTGFCTLNGNTLIALAFVAISVAFLVVVSGGNIDNLIGKKKFTGIFLCRTGINHYMLSKKL